MLDTEVVRIYLMAIEGLGREATEAGADLWCEVLREQDFPTGREAIVNLLSRSNFASPAEVLDEIKRLHEERLAKHGPIIPPADLTQPEEREWLRKARQAVKLGHVVPDNGRGELKARPPLKPIGRRV